VAYDALHGANRKALTAILLAQGLRPTRTGGHIAVYDAVHAQLEPPLGRDLATYHRVRRARNAGDSFMSALLDGLAGEGLLGPQTRAALGASSTEALGAVLARAAAAAAVTVGRPGANPPDRAELRSALL